MSGTSSSNGVVFRQYKPPEGNEAASAIQGLEGFCSCASKNREKMFIFGGSDIDGVEQKKLFCFDFDCGWVELACNGENAPNARLGACMCFCDDKLYLFGGCTPDDGWKNDLFCYDIAKQNWERYEQPTEAAANTVVWPSHRDKTSLVAGPDNSTLYLFGGFGPKCGSEDSSPSKPTSSSADGADDDDEIQVVGDIKRCQRGAEFAYYDELFQFHIATKTWKQVPKSDGWPNGLAAYSMNLLGQRLVIFGGKENTGHRSNSVHVFDTESQKWMVNPGIEGCRPTGRSFHATCSISDKAILLFGGRDNEDFELDDFNLLTVEEDGKMKWSEPRINDEPAVSSVPTGRYGHAMCVLKKPATSPTQQAEDMVVIYGGLAEYDIDTGIADAVLDEIFYANAASFLLPPRGVAALSTISAPSEQHETPSHAAAEVSVDASSDPPTDTTADAQSDAPIDASLDAPAEAPSEASPVVDKLPANETMTTDSSLAAGGDGDSAQIPDNVAAQMHPEDTDSAQNGNDKLPLNELEKNGKDHSENGPEALDSALSQDGQLEAKRARLEDSVV